MNRRALRLAVFSVLLPVPVALAAPQSATLPTEQLVTMSQVPVRGVGDTVLPRVLPLESKASERRVEPSASLTRLARTSKRAAASASKVAANGIPAAALRAYRTAEATMSVADPSCRLSWQLLAGIGRIESDHGRYAGAVLGADGVSSPQIVGLPLNGVGPVAAIADSDNGALDGDTRWDRAVGPMQFIPSTWAMVGVDGDGDGKRDPHDIDDAALAAAAYLCVGGHDLSTSTGMTQAVFSYNHSADYVALVVGVARAYASGAVDLPLLTATLQLPTGSGVSVDLSNGRGVPIGGSDDVSDPAQGRKAGNHNRADRADDRAQGGAGNGSDDRGRGGSDGRTGGDPSDDQSPRGTDRAEDDRPAGGDRGGDRGDDRDNGAGSGEDTNGDGGQAGDDESPEGAGGSTGGDGGGGSNDGATDGGGTGDDNGDGGDDSGDEDVVEEPEEPVGPVIGHVFEHGTLVDCDGDETNDELTLCLDDAGSPVAVDDPSAYEGMLGTAVTVIYHTEDEEIQYVDAIEEGTVESYED